MFTDKSCPICGALITVELDADASLRFQCARCRETAIYDILPEFKVLMKNFMGYLSERAKEIEGGE